MCGIYGMVSLGGVLRWPERADRLAAVVRHRGPDAHGRHAAPHAILGVHRLRVVDPSPAADQPFAHGTGVLALNGEIYNAPALRRLSPAHPWQSRSDAEALVPLLSAGDPGVLRGVAGMFGLAWWCGATRTLVLARDRAGEKPLFYVHAAGEVWFASSQDALEAHPQLTRQVDPEAVRDFLTLGVVRPPRTIRDGVRAVPPGTALVLDAHSVRTVRYDAAAPRPRDVGVAALASAIEAAVERQLHADVPVGLFLSGGLDSSLVAALAARHRPALRAYTVGFADRSFDERPFAARLASDLALPLRTVEAGPAELLAAREAALQIAEPIADPALLPTILLAERAREDVTVVLSGEGADELFGGYPTYLAHRMAEALPPAVARAALRLVPQGTAGRRMPIAWLVRRLLEEAGADPVRRHVAWFGGALPADALANPADAPRAPDMGADPVALAMELDRTLWLPERLLTKLDRATMRVALEARAPFLDPAVTALARAVRPAAHVGLRGKRLLREVARTRVPPYILRRTKRGMTVPIGALLNGGLRAEVDRVLAPARLRADGVIRPDAVARLLAAHRAGHDHGRALWTLLTLEAWRERHGLDG